MFIARQIRKENVAEYILYIWQLEDLLRACRFDPDKIYATLLEGNDSLDDAQKREALEWYLDLATLMREEDKAQIGHIDHTLHLINDLNDLHLRLLKLPVGEEYRAVFAPLSGELPKIKKSYRVATGYNRHRGVFQSSLLGYAYAYETDRQERVHKRRHGAYISGYRPSGRHIRTGGERRDRFI